MAVRPRGEGYRIEVDFASLEDALKLAERFDGSREGAARIAPQRAISSAG